MEQDERRELEGAMPASGTPEEEPGKTAVQEGRVYVLPRDLFHYKPNARWAESYAYLYELLFEA